MSVQSRQLMAGISIAALVTALHLGSQGMMPAWAEGFPGKGNPADWSDALPYYNLANRYLSKARYEDAAQKYREAISRYQFDPDFFINLGVACRKLDDYAGAEAAFRKAILLNNTDWMSWSNLGNACLKQNRLQDTINAFSQALKCNPPASEKAALQKDIADIKKILSMQAPPQPGPGSRKNRSSKAAVSSGSHGGGSKTRADAPAGDSAFKPIQQITDQKVLSGSGWDALPR